MYFNEKISQSALLHVANGQTLILGVLGLCITYYIGGVIYNIYFHPLAKFPGPTIRAASAIPYAIETLIGTISTNSKAMHDKYGEVVRFRPDGLDYNSAQGWKEIYGHRLGKKQIPKDREFFVDTPNGVSDIIRGNDSDHSRLRRILAHAFSEQALREQEPLMTKYFNLLISQLQAQLATSPSTSVDMTAWYNFASFDIIGDLAFGVSFDALATGTPHPWIINLFGSIKASRFLRLSGDSSLAVSAFKLLARLLPSLNARTRHYDFSASRVASRLAMTKTDRKDFLSYILKANAGTGPGMTGPEIENNIAVLVLAGSETTATLLSGTTFYLLRNPAAYAKLKQEVRTAFATPEDITLQSTALLPYLHAVLEEGLRIYPPVPAMLPRRTTAAGDVVGGMVIPGNTTIGVNQWATYHSARNFAEPDDYIPERWLGDARFSGDDKACFQPFSMGPRNCLGRNLAYAEMRSILARMVWHFDMQLEEGMGAWAEQKVFGLWEKGPLLVRLVARKLQ